MSPAIVDNPQQSIHHHQVYSILAQRLAPEALQWLMQTIERSQAEYSDRFFLTAFSLLPRQLGLDRIQSRSIKVSQWIDNYPSQIPEHWTLETLGRSLLLLSQTPDRLEALFSALYSTGSVNEQVALLQVLPLLAENDRYLYWAQEGFRSHITAVFNAIALNNPYPAKYFDSTTWNQLILKAIFIDSPLHLIRGLDDRASSPLARMAIDYVHERWAAGRSITPEIWRLISPFALPIDRADLVRALQTGEQLQRSAIALLCSQSNLPEISNIIVDYPDLQQSIDSGLITWEYIYQQQYRSLTSPLMDPLADGNEVGIRDY